MIYFLGVIFLLFIAGIVYMIFFEKPEKLTKKQKDLIRKKSGRFKW